MYPHRIRLRGPWEVEPQGAAPGRLMLPATWDQAGLGEWTGRVVLRRRFGYPGRIDPDEHVWLVGEGVEGPAELSLQGQPLAEGIRGDFAVEVTSLLGQRNVLEVTLDAGPDRVRLWDDVALEVRASAFLEGIRRVPGAVEGRVTGTCAGPLEVYVLAGSHNLGYQVVRAGESFRIPLEGEPPGLRVELVHVSTVWFVVELLPS